MASVNRIPWGKSGRRWIEAQARYPANYEWQRVSFASWFRVGFDGVATFARGEMAEAAAAVNPETGEVSRVRNAPRAVKRAIQAGWLEEGSTTTRAVVPGNVYGIGKW